MIRSTSAIEEEVGDITVDSVWLIKKTIADDGFQEWHQDFKHKITKTIVGNVGVASTDKNTVEVRVVNEDDPFRFPKQSLKKDDNGVILAPSCVTGCYVQGRACNHDKIKLQLNKVGDYVVFPSLWWHCGYCDFAAKTSDDHAIFTAQFFASPRSDISSKTSQMTSHIISKFNPTKFDSLTKDLLSHWED